MSDSQAHAGGEAIDRRAVLRLLGASVLAPTLAPFNASEESRAWYGRPAPSTPDVEIALRAAPDELSILPGAPTRVWRYSAHVVRGPATAVQKPDSFLGPVLRLTRGQQVRIRFRNDLPEPSIVHWHGLDVPERADGHPRLAVPAGGEYVYDFQVINRAGTYWYHPHPHMRTAPQVYQGLAGLVIVSDPEEATLQLPDGDGELVWVLHDRRFDTRNQLIYASSGGAATGRQTGRGAGGGMGMGGMARGTERMRGPMREAMEMMNGWLGDRLLVSGREPRLVVLDRRSHRIRLLNGSNARIYKLGWSDRTPFTVIGGDGGLLERARTTAFLTLAPGQRADLVLDLTDRQPGSSMTLRSVPFEADAAGHVGMMRAPVALSQGAPLDVMTVSIGRNRGRRTVLPERLSTPPAHWAPRRDAPVRQVPLTFRHMEWSLGGRTFGMDDVAPDETVRAGSTHVWELRNEPNPMGMAMAHPIHLHGPQFRVLSRAGGGSNALREGILDDAPTDTVLVLPGETVRVQVTFSKYPGLYLYHCHILEHEDMGMMRNFKVLPA